MRFLKTIGLVVLAVVLVALLAGLIGWDIALWPSIILSIALTAVLFFVLNRRALA